MWIPNNNLSCGLNGLFFRRRFRKPTCWSNSAGSDDGNEWVTVHNPSNESVDIGNWTFETTHGSTVSVWIAEGTILYPGAYCTYTPHYGWLDNSEEAIIITYLK